MSLLLVVLPGATSSFLLLVDSPEWTKLGEETDYECKTKGGARKTPSAKHLGEALNMGEMSLTNRIRETTGDNK